jgi:tetratricopeptide (TPR) repeat protein
LKKALHYFSQAFGLKKSASILLKVAQVKQKLKDHRGAIMDFMNVLNNDKDNFLALVHLGFSFGELESFVQASEYYIKALDALPVLPADPANIQVLLSSSPFRCSFPLSGINLTMF